MNFNLVHSFHIENSGNCVVVKYRQVEEVERAAKWAAHGAKTGAGKTWIDANRTLHKARRLAKKALVFEDEDGELSSLDYDLLLSAEGAIEKTIAIYKSHSHSFNVPAGSAFVWRARVKKFDVGFAVREQSNSHDAPIDIRPVTNYRSESQIQGKVAAQDHNRVITLVFDNSYSKIQRKQVAYWVSVGENVSLEDDALSAARSKEVMAAEEGPME
jgi:hypothetical protein